LNNSKSAYPNDAAQQILNHFYFLPLALLVFPFIHPPTIEDQLICTNLNTPFHGHYSVLIWLSSFAEEMDKVLSQVI
jgi:hypothetical protein